MSKCVNMSIWVRGWLGVPHSISELEVRGCSTMPSKSIVFFRGCHKFSSKSCMFPTTVRKSNLVEQIPFTVHDYLFWNKIEKPQLVYGSGCRTLLPVPKNRKCTGAHLPSAISFYLKGMQKSKLAWPWWYRCFWDTLENKGARERPFTERNQLLLGTNA